MADEKTDEKTPVPVPPQALKSASAFVAKHGKPAKAVVENIGRKGARVLPLSDDPA